MSVDHEQKAPFLENNHMIFVPQHPSYQSNYTTIHFQPIPAFLPALKYLSKPVQETLLAVLMISLLVGTYFKFILYGYFWCGRHDKNNHFRNRPINAMILFGAIIHHATHLFMGVNYVLSLGFNVNLGEYLGEFYCNLTLFVATFAILYLIIGSMTIAIFRVLYIKFGTWSKYLINNKLVIVSGAVLGSIILSLIITTLYIIESSSERVIFNACMDQSATMTDIIYQYRGNKPTKTPYIIY